MSYCRFGKDSDLYAYHSITGGYLIHVARNRVKSIPDKNLSYEEWMNNLEPIGLEHDGDTYWVRTIQDTLDLLALLKLEGYNVPDYAIDRLQKEYDENSSNP